LRPAHFGGGAGIRREGFFLEPLPRRTSGAGFSRG
jgi:hypothetical protein